MKCASFVTSVCTLLAVAGAAFGGEVSGSGLVVLDPSGDSALLMVGNSRVQIPTRVVYVNSSSNRAISTQGAAVIDAPLVNVVGGVQFSGGSGCTGTVREGVAACVNPYQNLAFPSAAGAPNRGSASLSHESHESLYPGFYSSISVTGNSVLHLEPGTYLIGEGGFKATSGSVYGEGVTIVMLSGALELTGASILQLSPPESGDMAGVVIAQPASNNTDVKIAGGRDVLISGSLYAPGARIILGGNSNVSGEGPQMGDLVVAHRVALAGTATIKIGGPGTKPIELPSQPLYD